MARPDDTDQSHRTADRLPLTDAEDRAARMRGLVADWIDDLLDAIGTARASAQFQRWLDAQAQFHDYSYRNALLITRQYPGATKVAGYRTWQEEFDRHVTEGASAIWIWAPITAPACPDCGDSASYRDHDDCTSDTPPDEWAVDVVGYKPVPVFDVSQTAGEPLPTLETAATGGDRVLLERVRAAHDPLDVEVDLVAPGAWRHGQARGICEYDAPGSRPTVRVRRADDPGAVAGTLVHEYAHALLHGPDLAAPERGKREVEAEAVAYLVGRHLDLDVDGSALYLAAWDDEAADAVRTRLARISRTAARIVGALPDE